MGTPNDNSEEESDIEEFDIIASPVTIDQTADAESSGSWVKGNLHKRLAPTQATDLKSSTDTAISGSVNNILILNDKFNVNTSQIEGLKINPGNKRLKEIPVQVERINNEFLVKIGPCDLSGVGGHWIRELIIRDLAKQALTNQTPVDFTNIHVSACVGVRGRSQMIKGIFCDNREDDGDHMNAYVKVAGESNLTHWEPRKGPQRFFNGTICFLVTTVITSLFENGIRTCSIKSSQDATKEILKNPNLTKIFDKILKEIDNDLDYLVKKIEEKMLPASSSNNSLRK